jgi:hypothetical protein
MSLLRRILLTFLQGLSNTKRGITCEDFCPTRNEKPLNRFPCFVGGEPGLIHGYDRQRLQIFIGQTHWDDELILDKLAKQIADEIGEEDGILLLDPTSFPKKGNESVGVQRQWCGRLGKKENCQVATFLAYASSIEFALVDRRLYLPDVWIEDEVRCDRAGIPKQHQVKKTRHEQALTDNLGLPWVKRINGRGKKLPHKWITGDDEMGKVPWFRRKLRGKSLLVRLRRNESYMFAVPSNILIYDIDALGEYDETRAKELQRQFVNVNA